MWNLPFRFHQIISIFIHFNIFILKTLKVHNCNPLFFMHCSEDTGVWCPNTICIIYHMSQLDICICSQLPYSSKLQKYSVTQDSTANAVSIFFFCLLYPIIFQLLWFLPLKFLLYFIFPFLCHFPPDIIFSMIITLLITFQICLQTFHFLNKNINNYNSYRNEKISNL